MTTDDASRVTFKQLGRSVYRETSPTSGSSTARASSNVWCRVSTHTIPEMALEMVR
jgi:hypothetical protein